MRTFLIIPMLFVELIFLAVCWTAAVIHKPTGKRLTEWSIEHLPARDWYFDGGDDDK